MSMYSIKVLLLCFILLFSLEGLCQSDFQAQGESSVAINHDINSNYRINFDIKSRYFLHKNNSFHVQQQQIDILHFSTLNLNYNQSLSFGLQYRNRDLFSSSSNELRTTLQFNFTKQKNSLRFGHRFRSEQRFLKASTVFRQRYRFTLDFPLNGEQLDIGESYLVTSLETLLSLNKIAPAEIDQRITLQIGWQIDNYLKLQTGLEYRFEALNINTEEKLFLLTSAILKI